LRIAFTRKAFDGAAVTAESLRHLEATASLCEELGHHVEEADPGVEGEAIVPAFLTLSAANTVVNLHGHPTKGRGPRPDEVEKVTWAIYERGKRVSGPDYARAVNTGHRLGRQRAAFHADYDVLLTPGLADAAAKLGWIDMMLEDADEYWRRVFAFSPFTVLFNLTGQPALVLPLGMSEAGLPMATQLVARFGDEATLFRLAAQLEAARPWFGRKPTFVTATPCA
jgi:amidase